MVIWFAALCNLIVGYQHFRGPSYLQPWRWRHHGVPKRRYPTITVDGATTPITMNSDNNNNNNNNKFPHSINTKERSDVWSRFRALTDRIITATVCCQLYVWPCTGADRGDVPCRVVGSGPNHCLSLVLSHLLFLPLICFCDSQTIFNSVGGKQWNWEMEAVLRTICTLGSCVWVSVGWFVLQHSLEFFLSILVFGRDASYCLSFYVACIIQEQIVVKGLNYYSYYIIATTIFIRYC